MKPSLALTGWLLMAALLVATPAFAQDGSAVAPPATMQPTKAQTRVDTLLAGIERAPTPDDWAAVGPDAVPILVTVMNDTTAKIILRGRAAIGLGHFETPESIAALRLVLSDETTPALLLRKAIVALARMQRGTSVDAIAPHLEHRSKRVREAAVEALGGIGTPAARAALTERQAAERSKFLRELIATQLQKPVVAEVAVPPTLDETKPRGAQ